MKNVARRTDIITVVVLILIIAVIICLVTGVGKGSNTSKESTGDAPNVTVQDFNGKRAGIPTGSVHDEILAKNLPESEMTEFNSNSDMVTALLSDRIDFFFMVKESAVALAQQNQELGYLEEPVDTLDMGVIFGKNEKGDKLRAQMDEFLEKCKADGTLDQIFEYWGDTSIKDKAIDMSGLTGENGKLVFATTASLETITYIENGEIAGSDVDIAVRFCREYGYDIDVKILDFAGIIPGIVSGTYDFALNNIVITDERKESVNFSIPYKVVDLFIVARKADIGTTVDDSIIKPERMGIKTGSSYEPITLKYYPDSEYFYFDNNSDLVAALMNNKIDGFLNDEPVGYMMHEQNDKLDYIKDPVVDDDYHFGFQKDTPESNKLREEFNETIAELKADGTLDEMKTKWLGRDDTNKTFDDSELSGENGKLMVAVLSDAPPFSYVSNNKLTGYSIELTTIFARKYGYSVEFEQTTVASALTGLSSGKYDIVANSLSYTEERAKSIDFSDPFYKGGVVLVARASDIDIVEGGDTSSGNGSFISSIKTSFERNFITEARYKLILQGIAVTCIITLMSSLLGTILAFLVCMYRRTGSRLANNISNVYVMLLRGTPVVVLLMILYYVVFGKTDINAIWVAIIGFTLNFGAYTSEIMRSGIESIDAGQREAALALGYTENQAFFRFVFPQAILRFLPVYNGEIITLLKGSSVVGYIAIQDLAKMSDIIRSRTYEAFFPLIVTALIYYILAGILTLILKYVLKKVDPKKRRKKTAVKEVQ